MCDLFLICLHLGSPGTDGGRGIPGSDAGEHISGLNDNDCFVFFFQRTAVARLVAMFLPSEARQKQQYENLEHLVKPVVYKNKRRQSNRCSKLIRLHVR